jgi:hypothetical protein
MIQDIGPTLEYSVRKVKRLQTGIGRELGNNAARSASQGRSQSLGFDLLPGTVAESALAPGNRTARNCHQ